MSATRTKYGGDKKKEGLERKLTVISTRLKLNSNFNDSGKSHHCSPCRSKKGGERGKKTDQEKKSYKEKGRKTVKSDGI